MRDSLISPPLPASCCSTTKRRKRDRRSFRAKPALDRIRSNSFRMLSPRTSAGIPIRLILPRFGGVTYPRITHFALRSRSLLEHARCMRSATFWLLLAVTCSGQASGTWKLNSARSRFPDAPVPKSVTVRYELQPGGEVWTFYQVRADGVAETVSQALRFDGREYGCGGLGLDE